MLDATGKTQFEWFFLVFFTYMFRFLTQHWSLTCTFDSKNYIQMSKIDQHLSFSYLSGVTGPPSKLQTTWMVVTFPWSRDPGLLMCQYEDSVSVTHQWCSSTWIHMKNHLMTVGTSRPYLAQWSCFHHQVLVTHWGLEQHFLCPWHYLMFALWTQSAHFTESPRVQQCCLLFSPCLNFQIFFLISVILWILQNISEK